MNDDKKPYTPKTYEEFRWQQEFKQRDLRKEARRKADIAYNKGLFKSLLFRAPWLYLILRRAK